MHGQINIKLPHCCVHFTLRPRVVLSALRSAGTCISFMKAACLIQLISVYVIKHRPYEDKNVLF
jgi:hypothetical protein